MRFEKILNIDVSQKRKVSDQKRDERGTRSAILAILVLWDERLAFVLERSVTVVIGIRLFQLIHNLLIDGG